MLEIRKAYGERCLTMLASLEKYLPAGSKWTRPDGGLFVWAQLPPGLRDETLLAEALKEKVAFVPGSAFYANEAPHDFVRLNYSNRPPELIDEGMRRLGRAMHHLLKG